MLPFFTHLVFLIIPTFIFLLGLMLIAFDKIKNTALITLLFILNIFYAIIHYIICLMEAMPYELYGKLSQVEYFFQELTRFGLQQWASVLYFVLIFAVFTILGVRDFKKPTTPCKKLTYEFD